MKSLISSLLALSAMVSPNNTPTDQMFPAMKDEMARSISRLKLESHEAPYYIGYTVHDTDSVSIGATFGALTDDSRDHGRTLSVDVRIGDYKLDSASGSSEAEICSAALVFSGHRLSAWMTTTTRCVASYGSEPTAAYKQAIEGLESKKTYLKQNTVEDRPDSFSHETPVVELEPTATLEIDSTKWAANLRELTATFKTRPLIRSSQANLAALADIIGF